MNIKSESSTKGIEEKGKTSRKNKIEALNTTQEGSKRLRSAGVCSCQDCTEQAGFRYTCGGCYSK